MKHHGATDGTFLDLFSGTSVVAQQARLDGFRVIANDWQRYSYALQRTFLRPGGYPAFTGLGVTADAGRARPTFGLAPAPGPEADPLRRVLAYLEDLAPEEGPFFHEYCEGGTAGRAYFSRENGAKCEAVRNRIAAWRAERRLDADEEAFLVASLIETMDMLANTASVYGAHLKQVKKSARQPFVLRLPCVAGDDRPHEAHNEDAAALVAKVPPAAPVDVLYLDPPYNARQYGSNYHVLETLARWDLATFEPRGVTGLRPADQHRSPFCSRPRVRGAFASVLKNARHILVSYSEEGLLPEADLLALLREAANGGRVEPHKVDYKRFRADSDHAARRYKGDAVQEFLFYAEVRP